MLLVRGEGLLVTYLFLPSDEGYSYELQVMGIQETVSLDYTPRLWQQSCHVSKTRFTVLALHRRAGKTELALMELLDCAMNCRNELGAFFYVAPQLKQAKAIAWSRLKSRVGKIRSEEHTSELQSPCNLVCRLLLEKKKYRNSGAPRPRWLACKSVAKS